MIAKKSLVILALTCVAFASQARQTASHSGHDKVAMFGKKSPADLDAILAANPNTVLDFTAVWCGPCKRLGAELPHIASQFPHVYFLKIDADMNTNILKKFNVKSFPTVLFIKDGKEVGRQTGWNGKHTLITSLNKYFGKETVTEKRSLGEPVKVPACERCLKSDCNKPSCRR